MRSLLVVNLLLLTSTINAIYEDQVGKFDWRKPLIGCPTDVIFHSPDQSSASAPDRLFVITQQNIIASLCPNSGKIEWRRVLEPSNSTTDHVVLHNNKDSLYTISNDGRLLRVWRSYDGALIRQIPVSQAVSERSVLAIVNEAIFVSTDSELIKISPENDITRRNLPYSANVHTRFFRNGDSLFLALTPRLSEVLSIFKVNEDGSLDNEVKLNFKYDPKRCHIQTSVVSCFEDKTLTILDVPTFGITTKKFDFPIENISGSGDTIIVRGATVLKTLTKSGLNLNEDRSVEVSPDDIVSVVSEDIVAVVSHSSIRTVYKSEPESKISREITESDSPPKLVFSNGLRSKTGDYELVIVGSDCRVEMLTVSSSRANVEWSKEESLINSVSVEMVDLPLSESQQMIEDEFEEADGNMVSAFVRRLHVQVGQLFRSVTKSVENIVSLAYTISNDSNGLASFISSLRSASSLSPQLFERDYFNLRKVILVSTLNGAVFGIDSKDGSIIWKLWLGADFEPLMSASKNVRVPLYVQRSTAHYQLDGVASVLFSHKKTKNGVAVSFNPMNGKVQSRKVLASPIRRIVQLPVTIQKHIFPLAVIDDRNEILSLPSATKEELSSLSPLFLLDVDERESSVRGLKVDFSSQKTTTTWSGNIGLDKEDKIIAVKGKSFNQKVHSQGRVLLNREVQYKYVNPNLAAVASLHKLTQMLTIVLVDVVTGQVIHSASIGKASEPVHLVHCENWIAYSYWSEKGRRTEIGIIELYEGSTEQAQKDVFNSKLVPSHPPVVITQSYIYAQGVDAMTVSETEKGLTTRSLLVAHPTGGIHEISRKILDATRPFELTQAMREEMIIGYIPEIPAAAEELINYNQTIYRVRGIKTSPSGLESTSLILAYGTDLFFTRLTPSGTFDILKDDFDHVLISIVLSGLIFGSYVTKRLSRTSALSAQWS